MFGWKRRRDGFEWREYVRTTILLKRKKRADRVAQAREAAVEGLKAAAERGAAASASGARAAGEGVKRAASGVGAAASHGAGRMAGQAASAAKRAAGAMRGGMAGAMRATRRGLWYACDAAGRGLGASAERLRSGRLTNLKMSAVSGLRLDRSTLVSSATGRSAAIAGGWALIGAGIARAALQTFDIWAAGLALAGSGLALLGRFGFAPAARRLKAARQAVEDRLQKVDPAAYVPSRGALRTGATAAIAAIAGAGLYVITAPGPASVETAVARPALSTASPPRETGSIVPLPVQKTAAADWLSLPELPSFSSFNPFADTVRTVSGRARVLTGDTLTLAGETLKLEGIEAPEVGQTCSRPGARRWRCGVAAEQALDQLVRRAQVTCDVGSTVLGGVRRARCRAGTRDLAEALVSSGHVFASEGFFAPYASQEAEARARKAGIWRGEPVRPAEFRDAQWARAVKSAPGGCPIKGRADQRRGNVYVLPWSVSYERFNVRERNGDRWFCSEEEAIEAGWLPFERS